MSVRTIRRLDSDFQTRKFDNTRGGPQAPKVKSVNEFGIRNFEVPQAFNDAFNDGATGYFILFCRDFFVYLNFSDFLMELSCSRMRVFKSFSFRFYTKLDFNFFFKSVYKSIFSLILKKMIASFITLLPKIRSVNFVRTYFLQFIHETST